MNRQKDSALSAPFMRSGIRRRIRVRKEESAFVYFVLEASEGITSYSTLEFEKGSHYRDLELLFTPEFSREVDQVLDQLGEAIYEL